MLEVFAPGTKVEVGDDKLSATIVSVNIKGNGHVEYNVGYWKSDNTYTEVWLPVREVKGIAQSKRLPIGFATC